MSSSFTYTLTNRRSSPEDGSNRPVLMPGKRRSRSASSSPIVLPSPCTTFSPCVWTRSGAGTRTSTISPSGGSHRAAAERLVVDQLLDGRVVAAERALRIAADLDLAELHRQRIVEEQAVHQWLAQPQDQLHRLGRLDDPDHPRQR